MNSTWSELFISAIRYMFPMFFRVYHGFLWYCHKNNWYRGHVKVAKTKGEKSFYCFFRKNINMFCKLYAIRAVHFCYQKYVFDVFSSIPRIFVKLVPITIGIGGHVKVVKTKGAKSCDCFFRKKCKPDFWTLRDQSCWFLLSKICLWCFF